MDYLFHGYCLKGKNCSKMHYETENKYQKIKKELLSNLDQNNIDIFDLSRYVNTMKREMEFGDDFAVIHDYEDDGYFIPFEFM